MHEPWSVEHLALWLERVRPVSPAIVGVLTENRRMKTFAFVGAVLALGCCAGNGQPSSRICEPGAVQVVATKLGDRVQVMGEYRACVRVSKNFGGVYGWVPLASKLAGSDLETAIAEGKVPEGVSTW